MFQNGNQNQKVAFWKGCGIWFNLRVGRSNWEIISSIDIRTSENNGRRNPG